MKTTTLMALLASLPPGCHAFTLDFAGHSAGEFVQSPRAIFVPGYGEIIFEHGLGSTLVVSSGYPDAGGHFAPTADFDPPEPVNIILDDPKPLHREGDFMADGGGKELPASGDLPPPRSFPPSLPAAGDGVGVRATAWNAIPKATAAALGLIGILLLAKRRKR